MNPIDGVFVVGNILLSIALLPSIVGPRKPDVNTSVVTAMVLTAFAVGFGLLHLWPSMATCAVTADLWWVLVVQSFRNPKGVKSDALSDVLALIRKYRAEAIELDPPTHNGWYNRALRNIARKIAEVGNETDD